jgi:outer membrane protein assembly factor BamB
MHPNAAFCFLQILVLLANPHSVSAADELQTLAATLRAETGFQGGLIVHLGSGDGSLTAALADAPAARLIHRLDRSAENVARLREGFRRRGLLGSVSVQQLVGSDVPLIDNVVNLLVIDEGDRETPAIAELEILRVLCPGGTAYVRREGAWQKTTKAWPDGIDQWTHYLHSPNNNAVADDRLVSHPSSVQWVSDPKWARHHNHLSGTSAMVTSGGRLFAIMDEGPAVSISLPPEWRLVARDAFNGILLWKKEIGPWEGHLRPFRSGPTDLQRRLVAVGDRVYVTLSYGAPVSALDAATGEVLHEYAGSEGTTEILCDGETLYLVAGDVDREAIAQASRRGTPTPEPRNRRVLAVDVETGRTDWTKSDRDTSELLPATLCLDQGRLFFHAIDHLVCLDASRGEALWRSPRKAATRRLSWSTPTVMASGGVVFCADTASAAGRTAERIEWQVTASPNRGGEGAGRLIAYSAEDGRLLWETPTAQGYNAPPDVFLADGLIWTSTVPNIDSTDFTEGRDPQTGEVRRRLDTSDAFTTTHHHRCYRNKATNQFIVLGRTGTELIDLSGELHLRHCWVRGACQYGVMPANGLLYAPPHACACYIQSKLSGFWALSSSRDTRTSWDDLADRARWQAGPGDFEPPATDVAPRPDAWPTYRGDAARRGRAGVAVSSDLEPAWSTQLTAPLTSPVVSDGLLLAASTDAHTVHALEIETGLRRWSFSAGGRIDSPPTIHAGTALFGSADGYVYCLRLSDGQLRWQFLAAPVDRRVVSFGQLESVWPVTGSVLVSGGIVYCTAGRSSYLDGGMVLWRVDACTGKPIGSARFDSREPDTGRQPEDLVDDVEMPGKLPDVLACDGENLFLRDARLDLEGNPLPHDVPHMYSSAGLLDDHWWHRTYWIYGTRTYGRASGWAVVANHVPSGRLMVLDDTTVFGFGRAKVGGGDRGLADVPLHLYRAEQEVEIPDRRGRLTNNNVALSRAFVPSRVKYLWSRPVPLAVRGMVLAGDTLFVVGPAMEAGRDAAEPDFRQPGPSRLVAFRGDDGQSLAEYDLDAQAVFDGLIAAGGRLYLTCQDGTVRSWKEKSSQDAMR